jgi:N-acetylated-alpha-linked acidic dipeptidase
MSTDPRSLRSGCRRPIAATIVAALAATTPITSVWSQSPTPAPTAPTAPPPTTVAPAAPTAPPAPNSPAPWKAGDYFPPSLGPWPAERITPLLRAVDPVKLRHWHDLLASEPHVAGSPGDLRQADRIVEAFTAMGLEVEKHEIFVYLARPVTAILELVTPANDGAPETRKPLVLKENILPEDADSSNPDLSWGWSAYSGSGDVTAEVVYANRGTKADFAALQDLGVNVRGKVVLCRYGGNFRGYKVKFAQTAGAAAVVIFTDGPDTKIPVYPGGGAPNDTCIERGSIITLDYPGDPLTPGIEATRDAPRLDADRVDLPTIPVQPIGWGAARDILIRMAAADDATAPSPALPPGWQGGIPVPYRIVGGPGVRLRVKVEQVREIVRTFNIIGTLRGEIEPDRYVLVGSHHDAWGFGACDPTCGTICTMEAARVFSDAARSGQRPRRTLCFCAWGAEEFGIIGSTEWVEANLARLATRGIAYLNLDMSAMGPNFGSAAAPSLKTLITEVSRHIPAVGSTIDNRGTLSGPSVFDTWIAREPDPRLPGQPKFGDLGGGSDHVAFWCRAGVPSASLGGGGTPGSAYHSVYDTLAWYRRNVGDDYQSARMVAQSVVATLARLADDPTPPLDNARTFFDLSDRLHALAAAAGEQVPGVADEIEQLVPLYSEQSRALLASERDDAALPPSDAANAEIANQRYTLAVCDPDGLPTRGWYRNDIAGPDADSGYASWILPRLTLAIERRDPVAARAAIERYRMMTQRLAAGSVAPADQSRETPPAPSKTETGR